MMTLFHGGTDVIQNPKVDVGRLGLDFGRGFYATTIFEQACKWAQRASRQRLVPPVVNAYIFDKEKAVTYRGLSFNEYDIKWLEFVVSCRGGYDPSKKFDFIEGGVANDRVIDTVEGYINGTIDAEHALNELSRHRPNQQICFLNESVIRECLTFKEVVRIDAE